MPELRRAVSRDSTVGRVLFPVGTTVLSSTAYDPSGNSSSCTWTVTVNDVTAPRLSALHRIPLVFADSSQCGTVVDYPLSAFDACGYSLRNIDTSSVRKGDFFPLGVYLQSIVAEDPSGNSDTCTFKVEVVDRTPPVVSCHLIL
ncbi:MAG: HYR domain-containing protein [Bacteroidia bacterium]